MGTEKVPFPGKLIMGILWGLDGDLDAAEDQLTGMFGPVQFRSKSVPFGQYSDYYQKEMGSQIHRCLWAFERPLQRGVLVEVKLATNRMERIMERSGKRTVNLDPGLLTLEAVSLATTKPYYHRIYVAKGIYVELTLIYRNGSFEPLPWTYPDYKDEWALDFFLKVRGQMLKEWRGNREG